MRPVWLRWQNPLVWLGALFPLGLLIGGWAVWRANHEVDPAYGSALLSHAGGEPAVLFAIAFGMFACGFIPFPFQMPSRFSPRNLRWGALILLLIAASSGWNAFLDLWDGPVQYQGTVSIGIVLTSAHAPDSVIFGLAGKEFTITDPSQFPLVHEGRCLRVTYAAHSDLATDLHRC